MSTRKSTILPFAAMLLLLPAIPFHATAQSTSPKPPPVETRHPPPQEGLRTRRPAEQWLESLKRRDPDEYERLQHLRAESPEVFTEELRARLQQRAVDMLLNRHPELVDCLNRLPPATQQAIRDSLYRLVAERRIGRHAVQTDTAPPRHARLRGRDREAPAPSGTGHEDRRARLEEAYDRQTERFETEVDRVARQLEQLRRLLEARKARREKAIDKQMRP